MGVGVGGGGGGGLRERVSDMQRRTVVRTYVWQGLPLQPLC